MAILPAEALLQLLDTDWGSQIALQEHGRKQPFCAVFQRAKGRERISPLCSLQVLHLSASVNCSLQLYGSMRTSHKGEQNTVCWAKQTALP